MSNYNSLPYFPKGSPRDTELLRHGSETFSAPKQYRRLKSLTSVAGTFNRLRKERLLKKKTKQSSSSPDLQLNQNPDYMGVSLIQAARNGWAEMVKAHLDAGIPGELINDVDEEGFTALHIAARYNQVEVMKLLVRYGADVNVKQGQDEVRPLHLASRYNSEAAAFFLIGQMKAPVNIKDAKGRTPLHYATRKGHGTIIKLLISSSSCRVNEPDSDKTTPLIMAALQGSASICETLISRGAEVELRDVNNMTALMWAAAEGHTQVCTVLLKAAQRHGNEAQRRYIRVEDKEGNTALHLAVQNGGLEVVNLLLCHGAEVDSFKKNRASPLHLAASNGFADIVKVLVYNGADVNAKDIEQMTPVHRAALYNKVEVLEFLVKKGADVNAKDKKNMSPLHCACWKGQTEAVDFLLQSGANIGEIDITLKTALHWAVQYGHLHAVQKLLKEKSCQGLVSCTDKNDQTVLHYAAYTGDVQTLLLLMEAGARPDAKDQEERSPLHIAAQNDRVSCIEALIQSSNHETNDDDLDGRTPLLLACLSGHHQAVQVLLALGSDVSRRDDEHCNALMLAASQGHTLVMKILLDNHAAVNDIDKMRNTALHYACAGGHVEAVQLLLDRKAEVMLKNTHLNSALDLAIDNLHQEVVLVMLKNKSFCQDCMSVRDEEGHTPIDRLIARLPETVLIILDHCVERTSRDDEEKNLTMSFDYQYIDPGPDDPSCTRNRYLALNTMVAHGRDVLLSHPLCQNLLFQKWVGFGRSMFIINLLTYIGYLTCLTVYVTKSYSESINCPFFDNKTSLTTSCLLDPSLTNVAAVIAAAATTTATTTTTTPAPRPLRFGINGTRWSQMYPPEEFKQTVSSMITLMFLLYFFVGIFFLRDLMKIFSQKWRYFMNIYNTIVWMLMVTTVVFVADEVPCSVVKWRAGWMAMFLAWINFIMYLRRIDFLGIYVIMFVSVLSSLVKLILVFFMFCAAFVGSMYILLANRFVEVYEVWKLFIRVLIMTLGEIEKEENKEEFSLDADFILVIFLFLMPIALMNLMIGVAVGDIEKIQKNAYLKRISLQVDLMYNIENNMPRFLQKKVHIRKATIKPNEEPNSRCSWFWCFAKQRKVQFIQAEKKDQMTSKLEALMDKMHVQHQRTKNMMICIQQQGALLQQIAQRLDVQDGYQQAGQPFSAANQPPYGGFGGHGGAGGFGGHGGAGGFGVHGGAGGVEHFNLSSSMSQLAPPFQTMPRHQKATTTLSGHSSEGVPGSQGGTALLPVPESVSVYANVNIGGVDRWRKRSIRPAKSGFDGVGRPRSFV